MDKIAEILRVKDDRGDREKLAVLLELLGDVQVLVALVTDVVMGLRLVAVVAVSRERWNWAAVVV